MIRIAAAGDLHLGLDSVGQLAPRLERLGDQADALLLAGDLTRVGDPAEAAVLARELAGVAVPIVAVLGNHDYHTDQQDEVTAVLRRAGVMVVEGEAVVLDLNGGRVGVAGVKGFGSGFPPASASDFGEPEMKAFVRHGRDAATRLGEALASLDTSTRVALSHYSPVPDTLAGEPLEIYPFLGSSALAEAIDAAGATIAIHGHAHKGTLCGATAGGIPVRNVAQPVIRTTYCVFELDGG